MQPEPKAWPGSQAVDLGRIAAAFGHLLHAAGVPVTPERSTRFGAAIAVAEPTRIDALYWLGRTTLLSGRDQIERYDAVFDQVFRGIVDFADYRGDMNEPPTVSSMPSGEREPGAPERSGESSGSPNVTSATPGAPKTDDDPDDEESSVLAAMSAEERLAEKSFALCTQEELELLADLVARLPLIPPMRKARRTRAFRSGDRLDVRRTLRRAHRTGGDPVRLVHRKPTVRPRRIVLIADISGSMEPYARVYLHLMRGAVQALGAEAFVFATRLTRLTRALAESHPDIAYQRASAAAPDWSGGTRIGQALMDFVELHGRRGMARGAVVVIVSDGWEISDPAMVGEAMQRLSRLAHHVIWVNPRKAVVDYQPLVGGMAAALPYVDTFISGHSYQALEEVMAAIAQAGKP
jgi:uncharacterized protein with von Willebrand factor type A (vWA) domain